MPLYSYECRECGAIRDEFRKVDNRNDPLTCKCGESMFKLLGGHSVVPDLQPYYDDNLESFVKSKQHRKKLMRERGVDEKYGKRWM